MPNSKSMMRRWLFLFLLCLLPFVAEADEVAVPKLAARVTDLTATLTATQQAALESRLRAFEAQKGSQVAVLIVPTTRPEAIEQYAIRVVEQWKLGRKKVDDGVLLLVAKDDRKLRIEVGYGLEGVLPDVIARRIIAEDIAPHFKQGDFYGGIEAGVNRILAVIQGEALPAPPAAQRQASGGASLESYFPFLLFGALAGAAILRRMLGTFPGALANGGLVGLAVFLLGGGMIFTLLLGVMAFVFALGGGRGWGGGFSGGGGGFGGGISDGGGFSGGGGDFGGGGASGDW
ncbi:MAG: TPM domain-containing protein [Gallionellaceae bacterium]|nr:TPM domain-containing protein [Gallionellaceae bacterium]